jgi:RimJ/RimL family protein N-acetyltransferase
MLANDALRTKPTLHGQLTVLRPLGPEHAEVLWRSLSDPEGRRLTGTHTEFRRAEIDAWLTSRSEQHDRLDLAIHRRDDDRYVGELALTELDPANESVGIRIALAGNTMTGKGYGSEAMRTVLAHAFETVGIHRVHLDVYAFNTRAIRTYERLGFAHEGRARQALLWDGERHDALVMSMLRPEWESARHRRDHTPAPTPHRTSTTTQTEQPATGTRPAPDRDEDQP